MVDIGKIVRDKGIRREEHFHINWHFQKKRVVERRGVDTM